MTDFAWSAHGKFPHSMLCNQHKKEENYTSILFISFDNFCVNETNEVTRSCRRKMWKVSMNYLVTFCSTDFHAVSASNSLNFMRKMTPTQLRKLRQTICDAHGGTSWLRVNWTAPTFHAFNLQHFLIFIQFSVCLNLLSFLISAHFGLSQFNLVERLRATNRSITQ